MIYSDSASSPGHEAPKLKLSLITSTRLHLIISKIFIILHHLYCCYVFTLYNLFAHSSCTFLSILLFIKSTVYCLLILFDSLLHFIPYPCLCIFSCVYVTYNCTVHGVDLIYISLLVIFCKIVYVTNTNLESWIYTIQQIPTACFYCTKM